MMTTTPYPLKPSDPHDVLREVIYEIDSLVAVAWLFSQENNEFIKNALLEAQLLHTRNLIDFFEKSNRSTRVKGNIRVENDDVISKDYGFPPRTVVISQHDKERLHKALAHITYKRAEYRSHNQTNWPLTTTLLPILVPCEEFLEHLIKNFLRPVDTKTKEELSNLLARIKKLTEEINKLPRDT